MDEDLIYGSRVDTAHAKPPEDRIEIVPGVVFSHQDSQQVTSKPFAVDVQMPEISVDPNVRTSYFCEVFELPQDLNIVAYEGVWKNGTTVKDTAPPIWLHHQLIRHCPDPEILRPEWRNGKMFDCSKHHPGCAGVLGIAKSGFAEVPHGVRLPLQSGQTYILEVHYDNVYQESITQDTSGIRLWAAQTSSSFSNSTSSFVQTTPGRVLSVGALYASIYIPRDPKERVVEHSFMISSAATMAAVPPGGVQVFGTLVHMHYQGVRGRIKLIRNGVHVANVYERDHFDFNMQTIQNKPWKLLPGDTLIASCFYRGHAERDTHGGTRADDEMCDVFFGLAPSVKEMSDGKGWLVKPGEPFQNSYLGSSYMSFFTKDAQDLPYPPDDLEYIPFKDHRVNVCDLVTRDALQIWRVRFSSPEIPALVYLLATFAFFYASSRWCQKIPTLGSERIRRNFALSMLQLIFSIVALPILALDLSRVLAPTTVYDAVDPNTYATSRSLMTAQQLLFLTELFYRIDIRVEVWIHHCLSVCIFIFLYLATIETLATRIFFKVGLLFTRLAVTEQPMYLVLILKGMGYAHKKWWPPLCRFAGLAFVFVKILIVVVIILAMSQSHSGKEASWLIPT